MATVTSSKRHLVLTSDTYTSNGDVVVGGDLTIQGTTTTLNTANLLVEDKNIIIGNVSSPSDTTANGGGITLKGSNDYTITWSNANNRWDFNQGITSSGDITAANISGSTSGTNTGDQDLSGYSTTSHNHDGLYLPIGGGSLTGNVTSNSLITADLLRLTNDASDTTRHRISVYDSGATSYGMMLWNTNGTSGDWATMIYGPNQSDRRISFGKANANFATNANHAGVDELAWLDLDNGNYFTDGNIYPGGSTTKYVSTGRIDNWNTAYTHSQAAHAPSNAEANQTAAQLLTEIKTVDGSGSGLDADTLDGTQGSSLKRINGEFVLDVNDDYDSQTGTWSTGTSTVWGEPNITGGYAYNDGTGSRTYDVPTGAESCWISHLTWSSGGYVDVLGIQSDGGSVFLRRINTHQAVENSDEGAGQHDGSTITFAGTSLSSFGKIKFQNRVGRFHFTGITFSSSQWEGTEGTGMIHPAQITQQGSGNGLDSDKLDGQQGTYYLDYANFTGTPTIPTDFVSAANGGTFSGGLTILHDDGLFLKTTTNGGVSQIKFSDNSTSNSYAQIGHIKYQHSNTASYGSGESFIIGGTETSMTILADGKLMYNEGIYSKPSSGTGAGTRKDSNWDTAYGWGDHSAEGYITGVTNISGYAGTLLRSDNRIISPSEETAGRLRFGFTSWANNNTSPYADFLHLRSYTDSSGGSDNLVMFKKSGIGMRIWQQSFGSSTAYSNYVDVLTSADEGIGNGLDADLLDGEHGSYYANLSTNQTIAGAKTFTSGSNQFNGHLYYSSYDANGNHYPHYRAGSNANGTTINFRQYYNANSYINHKWKCTNASDAYFDFVGEMRPNGLNSNGEISAIGDIKVGSTTDGAQRVLRLYSYSADSKHSTIKTTNGNLHIDSEDGHALYLNYYEGASTNIYFGTGNGGYCGTVSSAGVLRMSNDIVAYYSFSDRRLKTDIKTTENNLEKILSLNPVEYTWKEGPREGVKEIGLIAQEVEEVVPEVVRVQSRHHDKKSEGEEYKQVDYEHLVSTLIGAMQEQQDQINDLKKEIQTLKNK